MRELSLPFIVRLWDTYFAEDDNKVETAVPFSVFISHLPYTFPFQFLLRVKTPSSFVFLYCLNKHKIGAQKQYFFFPLPGCQRVSCVRLRSFSDAVCKRTQGHGDGEPRVVYSEPADCELDDAGH